MVINTTAADSVSLLSESVARMTLKEDDEYFYSPGEESERSEIAAAAPATTIIPVVMHPSQVSVWSVEVSASVAKWLSKADALFQQIFMARTAQLAAGDRSYALSKRLQGCEYPMFETKLGRGMRVLWTQTRCDGKGSVLVSVVF
jgi:hypothetical protein